MNALIFLIETFSRLYLLTFLLRILFQLSRIDFYNPFAQFIVQVTNPLVIPARRIFPSVRKFDLPTLIVLVLLQFLVTFLIFALRGADPSPGLLAWVTVYRLVSMTIWVYIVCILVYVILSWVQTGYSPISALLAQFVEPILRPARRIMPSAGGLDLSPMIVTILLWALLILLNDIMATLLG